MKKRFLNYIAIAVLSLSFTISMAQVVEPVDKNKIANGGYDLVAYFADNAAVKGTSDHTADYHGIKYQFASADHQQLFLAAPEKYLPVCDGYCARGGKRQKSSCESDDL